MATSQPSGDLIEENSLRKLMSDRCPDGKSRSLTAIVLDRFVPPILDVCADRQDWAAHYLEMFGDSLNEPQTGFLKAVVSWHRSLVRYGFMETAGLGIGRATELTEALESGNPGREAVLKMLRAAPDESIDTLLQKTTAYPSIHSIITDEVRRRRRRPRKTANGPFRENRSRSEPNRPHSIAMRYWLRAPLGAPALCFWSWASLDTVLFPNSEDAIGEASRNFVRALGLWKASDHIQKCKVRLDQIELEAAEAGPDPDKPVFRTLVWPGNPYRIS